MRLSGEIGLEEHKEVLELLLLLEAAGEDGTIMVRILKECRVRLEAVGLWYRGQWALPNYAFVLVK